MRWTRTGAGFLAATLLLAGLVAPAQAEFTEQFSLAGDELVLGNLIGEIQAVGHDGQNFEIEVRVQGEDAARDLIEFETEEGGRAHLLVRFPPDEDRYVYPRMGRRSRSTFQLRYRDRDDDDWLRDLLDAFRGHRIEVRGSGRGMELWADIQVKVPRGAALHVRCGLGELTAQDIEGTVDLRTKVGAVFATGIVGDTTVDTGSGHVQVDDVKGNVWVDTGSGHVEAQNLEGESIEIDTGSGHVDLDEAQADEVAVDTGSGNVSIQGLRCRKLVVDTGSGGVETRDIQAEEAVVDTGSGSVRLDLLSMGAGPYRVDTGSGRITLFLPADASADVQAETGSGSIDVDVEDINARRMKRDHVDFEVGDGRAEVELDTGSGGIRIRQR